MLTNNRWRMMVAAVAASLTVCLATYSVWAQGIKGQGLKGNKGRSTSQDEDASVPGITDEKLLKLNNEFITKAEKLANDYKNSKNPEKARVVYEQILKLNPKHVKAKEALAKFKEDAVTANKKVVDVLANKKFQETGVWLIPGQPYKIEASGEWRLVISERLGPKGFEIPKEWRDFNFGALVGYVDNGDKDSKPFLIGEEYEDVGPSKQGQLMLAMWDNDPTDNSGKIKVTIQGTFNTAGKKEKGATASADTSTSSE